MDRLTRRGWLLSVSLGGGLVAASAGCNAVATAYWVLKDGKTTPPEYKINKESTVAVVCRGPADNRFRHTAHAPQQLARRLSGLLKENLGKKITLVPADKIAKVRDEKDTQDFIEIGKQVGADLVIAVDLTEFTVRAGRTLLNGEAELRYAVINIADGQEVFEKALPKIAYPPEIGGVAATDMSESQFTESFIRHLAHQIGKSFYDHDPRADFATYGL
jgi:hypothetical protein